MLHLLPCLVFCVIILCVCCMNVVCPEIMDIITIISATQPLSLTEGSVMMIAMITNNTIYNTTKQPSHAWGHKLRTTLTTAWRTFIWWEVNEWKLEAIILYDVISGVHKINVWYVYDIISKKIIVHMLKGSESWKTTKMKK